MKKLLYICTAIFLTALALFHFAGAATILFPTGGGTGTSTKPVYGSVLLGNAGGTYDVVATSSLGISGTSYWDLVGSDIHNNNAGNVGIGTASPDSILQLYRDADALTLMHFSNPNAGTNAAAGVKLSSDAGDSYIYKTSSTYGVAGLENSTVLQEVGGGNIVLYNSGENLIVNNVGNVTIPAEALIGAPSTALTDITLLVDQQTRTTGMGFINSTDGSTGAFVINTGSTGEGAAYLQGIRSDFGSYTNIALEPSGGNVGVGTLSPQYKFHIADDVAAGGWIPSAVVQTTNGNPANFAITAAAGTIGDNYMTLIQNNPDGSGFLQVYRPLDDTYNVFGFLASRIEFLTTPAGYTSRVVPLILTPDGNGTAWFGTIDGNQNPTDSSIWITNTNSYGNTALTFDSYAAGGYFLGRRATGDSGSPGLLADGDEIVGYLGSSWDGAGYGNSAALIIASDGGSSAADTPGKITGYTTSRGSNSVTARMELNNGGKFTLENTDPITVQPPADGALSWQSGNFIPNSDGTTYTFTIYAYRQDSESVIRVYENVGTIASASDPDDSTGYDAVLDWTYSPDASGYIVYYNNGNSWYDAGNTNHVIIGGINSLVAGTPTLTPTSGNGKALSFASRNVTWGGVGYYLPGGVGSTGYVLTTDGVTGALQWSTLNANVITGTLTVPHGGTGLTSVADGSLLYGSGSSNLSVLAKDTNATRYLSNQGTSNRPSWNQINLANGVTGSLPLLNGGTATTTFYNHGVVFSDGTKLTQSAVAANFYWDETNKRLGLGTSTPTSLFQTFSTATSTISIDSNSATRGSCIEMKDSDGSGYTYVTANNGVLTASTISCK